jgi:malate dehydrogenase
MREVAIVGAGELGGLVAHTIAKHEIARTVRLIDPQRARLAEGKALDIAQAAPLEGFSTSVLGTSELSTAASADLIVFAEPAASSGEAADAIALLARVRGFAPRLPIVCADSSHLALIERADRLGIDRGAILGSAAEALANAVRALVALEANVSASDVVLSVLGVPPSHIVVGWEDASIGGFAATRAISEPARRRLAAKVAALWPPGVYALASAASKVIDAMARARRIVTCFIAPDVSAGRRTRTAALPVRVGPYGVIDVELPELSAGERVALDNAMLL